MIRKSDVMCMNLWERWVTILMTWPRLSLRSLISVRFFLNLKFLWSIKQPLIGIPNIRLSQQQRMSYMKNLSTIATFFSGVSATTLQISLGNQAQQNLLGGASPICIYGAHHSSLHVEVVNAFWFCSLVFSIAAVINSLLGFTWNRAT